MWMFTAVLSSFVCFVISRCTASLGREATYIIFKEVAYYKLSITSQPMLQKYTHFTAVYQQQPTLTRRPLLRVDQILDILHSNAMVLPFLFAEVAFKLFGTARRTHPNGDIGEDLVEGSCAEQAVGEFCSGGSA